MALVNCCWIELPLPGEAPLTPLVAAVQLKMVSGKSEFRLMLEELPEQMVSRAGVTKILGLGFTKMVLVISTPGQSGVVPVMV